MSAFCSTGSSVARKKWVVGGKLFMAAWKAGVGELRQLVALSVRRIWTPTALGEKAPINLGRGLNRRNQFRHLASIGWKHPYDLIRISSWSLTFAKSSAVRQILAPFIGSSVKRIQGARSDSKRSVHVAPNTASFGHEIVMSQPSSSAARIPDTVARRRFARPAHTCRNIWGILPRLRACR